MLYFVQVVSSRMGQRSDRKFVAAFIKTWMDLGLSDEGRELLDRVEITEHISFGIQMGPVSLSLDQYVNLMIWYTDHSNFIDPDSFIVFLTPTIAQKAGYSEFSETDTSVGFHLSTEQPYYTGKVPEGLKESFLTNRNRWIEAFVKHNALMDILPCISEFTVDTLKANLSYQRVVTDIISPLLFRAPDAKEQIKQCFPTTLEALGTVDDLLVDETIIEPNVRFMGFVEENFRSSLRIVRLRESIFQRPEQIFDDSSSDLSFKIRVLKRDEEKWWFIVPFLLLEAGCTVSFIEDLVEEGVFDS